MIDEFWILTVERWPWIQGVRNVLNYYDWDSDCGDCEGSLIVTRGGALLNILCVEGGGRGRGGQGGVVRVPGKLIRLAPRRPRIRAPAPPPSPSSTAINWV